MNWIDKCSSHKFQVKQQWSKHDEVLYVTKTVSGNWHNVLKWIHATVFSSHEQNLFSW